MAKLIDIDGVCEMLRITRPIICERLKNGELPRPVKRWGPPQWDEDEIKKLLKPHAQTER